MMKLTFTAIFMTVHENLTFVVTIISFIKYESIGYVKFQFSNKCPLQ